MTTKVTLKKKEGTKLVPFGNYVAKMVPSSVKSVPFFQIAMFYKLQPTIAVIILLTRSIMPLL